LADSTDARHGDKLDEMIWQNGSRSSRFAGPVTPQRQTLLPKYFFHYRTDDELIEDTAGSELPDLEAAEHNAAALAKAIVERAASTGGDTRVPRSIEITDAAGEELLYLVFWAGPKLGDGSATPDDISSTVH
jgi:hypothetical protein